MGALTTGALCSVLQLLGAPALAAAVLDPVLAWCRARREGRRPSGGSPQVSSIAPSALAAPVSFIVATVPLGHCQRVPQVADKEAGGVRPRLSRKEVVLAPVPRTPCLSCARSARNRVDNCAVGARTGGRREKTELGQPIFGHLTEEVTSLGSGDEGAANQDETEGGVVPEAEEDGARACKKGLAQS